MSDHPAPAGSSSSRPEHYSMGVLIMDMTDYDGPTVAVLVRKTLVGPPKVDSVHPDTNTAYEHLGCEIVAGRSPVACGWEIVTVPASPTAVGTVDVDEPQRAVDDFREELAAALEMPADIRWHILLEAVRENREALEEQDSDDALLRELRSALAPIGPRAERLNRRGLLALVRELVRAEWSGTHGELGYIATHDGRTVRIESAEALDEARRTTMAQALDVMGEGAGAPSWTRLCSYAREIRDRVDSAFPWPADGRHASTAGLDRMARELRVLEGGGMKPWHQYSTAERAPYRSSALLLLNAYTGRLPSPNEVQADQAVQAFYSQSDHSHSWEDADGDMRESYLAAARANWA